MLLITNGEADPRLETSTTCSAAADGRSHEARGKLGRVRAAAGNDTRDVRWSPVQANFSAMGFQAAAAAALVMTLGRVLSGADRLTCGHACVRLLLGLGARRHDVNHRHVTQRGIVGIVEPILPYESLKIVDIRLPALRIVDQRLGENSS